MNYKRGKGKGSVNGGRVLVRRNNQSKVQGVNKGFCCGCKTELKDNQRALRCDSCELWFNLSCTDIEECLYKAIGEGESKGVMWFYQGCEGDISVALKSYNEVKKKQDAIES